jgi:uncharacterized protein (TIGR03084 family)
MTIFDDLAAEQDRLEKILTGLDETQWGPASAAEGWTVSDVVLHLAQTEEAAAATATRGTLSGGRGALTWDAGGGTTDERADYAVRMERAPATEVFARWQRARLASVAALRAADPDRPVQWVTGVLKPATLATTRLAEHWAHGLDITDPLGIDLPDTGRLRNIAWLAHRTLPYALSVAGEPVVTVRCELTAPDGEETWRFGPQDAESTITGAGGEFCRVATRRLDPAQTGLKATGPHGATVLRLIRTYAA